MIAATFLCLAPIATDGDTLKCQNGRRVRIAGIEANERGGGCHLDRCPTMPARQAKATLQRLVYRKRLVCQPVGKSWSRIVARCVLSGNGLKTHKLDLSCAAIASGAAVRWDRFWARYRMGECR
ncbi:MAG TPA: hypothetical protein VF637_00440 [Sphingomicrobium sp.]|jgi:endonuclease YncB( thermonuclease family)